QDLNKQLEAFNELKPPSIPTALALRDVSAQAPATYVLRRGEWRQKDTELAPGFLSALESKPAQVPEASPEARSTGRRSVLAQWLTQPDHPLTGRVMVNRLWQHHFGRGIVGTPGDFGIQGEEPTHPELLDWLARELVDRQWSLKELHRLMVNSATYCQASIG